jgi:hypothetical protein
MLPWASLFINLCLFLCTKNMSLGLENLRARHKKEIENVKTNTD